MAIQPAGRGPELIGVYSFFLALTTITVFLRTYCRSLVVKNFALDDWFALLSWIMFACLCAFTITGVFHGTGQHAAEIKPQSEIPVALKWWWASELSYIVSNMAIKASIAVMLLRLTITKTHRVLVWVTLLITEILWLVFFFFFVFQCYPSSYFWTQHTGGSGSCMNPRIIVNTTYTSSAMTCIGDWIFAILPFFLVWKLNMKPRQKVIVAMILAMGAFASTATIIRLPYLGSLTNQDDFLYATLDVALWSCCELGIGIAAASTATLRPLVRDWISRGKLFGNTSSHPYQQDPPWIANRDHSKGYVRSPSRGGAEELGMHDRRDKEERPQTAVEECEEELADFASDGSQTKITHIAQSHTKKKSDWGRKTIGLHSYPH